MSHEYMDGDAKFLSFDKAGVDENLNEKNTRAMLRQETGVGVWVTRQFTYPPGSLLLCYMPRSHSLASTWQRYKYLYWSSYGRRDGHGSIPRVSSANSRSRDLTCRVCRQSPTRLLAALLGLPVRFL